MKKCICLLLISLFPYSVFADSSENRIYASGMLTGGVYKLKGNEQYDGHFPTTSLFGFGLNAGISSYLGYNFYLLNEVGYNFAFRQVPAMDYSSLMYRMGFEANINGDSLVIPFATAGAGVVIADPANAFVQMDFGYELQAGVKVEIDDYWKIIAGMSFTQAKLDYSEKIETTTLQRVNGFLGVERSF